MTLKKFIHSKSKTLLSIFSVCVGMILIACAIYSNSFFIGTLLILIAAASITMHHRLVAKGKITNWRDIIFFLDPKQLRSEEAFNQLEAFFPFIATLNFGNTDFSKEWIIPQSSVALHIVSKPDLRSVCYYAVIIDNKGVETTFKSDEKATPEEAISELMTRVKTYIHYYYENLGEKPSKKWKHTLKPLPL